MKIAHIALALLAYTTSVSATLCNLGLPDPLGLCPKTTAKTTAKTPTTTTPKAVAPATTAATQKVTNPAYTTTPAPVVIPNNPTTPATGTPKKQTSTYTPPAAIPTDWTPTEALIPGNGPSTTLTVSAATGWDSTTTLLSVVVETSATFVPGGNSGVTVAAGSGAVGTGAARVSTAAGAGGRVGVEMGIGGVVGGLVVGVLLG